MSVEQIHVATPEGKSNVTVLTYGATVLSWKREGKEQLFLSSKAALDGSAAVRGGIPIVFPIFNKPTQPISGSTSDYPAKLQQGLSKIPKHGFTRTTVWKYIGTKDGTPGEKIVSFELDTDDHKEFYQYYPWHVKLVYEVHISDAAPTLTTELHVSNLSLDPAPFHALFHNYLRVQTAEAAAVEGLKGASYIDTSDEFKTKSDPSDPLTLQGKGIDSVFYRVAGDLKLVDAGRTLQLHQSPTFPTLTVWNPAAEGAAGIGDLHEGGWKEFLCLEPGSIKDLNFVEPHQTWTGSQILTVNHA